MKLIKWKPETIKNLKKMKLNDQLVIASFMIWLVDNQKYTFKNKKLVEWARTMKEQSLVEKEI